MESAPGLAAFLASTLMVVVLVSKRVNVALSLALGTLFFGIVTLRWGFIEAATSSFNATMLRTIAALALAMLLASLYTEVGASAVAVESLRRVGSRFAALSMPAIIGLLPMPGGAYVSAVVINRLYESLGLNAERKTFINFWFRHVWIATWPLYPTVILASGMLRVPVGELMEINWPITLFAVLVGLAASSRFFRPRAPRGEQESRGSVAGIVHLWPFLALALLTLAFNVDINASLLATTLLLVLVYRPGRSVVARSARHALNPTVVGLIVVSLVFGECINASRVAYALEEVLDDYASLAAFMVPFAIVLATGIEFTFVVLAFPPLLPLLSDPGGLLLSFAGGFAGSMLSPFHSCLVLSAEYYGAELRRVYRYLITSTVAVALLLLVYVRLLY